MFYYRGLKEWNNEKGYLIDTCLNAQDQYQKLKKKELYIKSSYDLELVSAAEAENYKKALMFDALEYYLDDIFKNDILIIS